MPVRNSFARAAGDPFGQVGGVGGGGLDHRVAEAALVGVEAAGGFQPGAVAFEHRRGELCGHRVDVDGDVDAAGVGQQRVEPGRADLGRVAADGEGGGVPVAGADVTRADFQAGGGR